MADSERTILLLPSKTGATPPRRVTRFLIFCQTCWPKCLRLTGILITFLVLAAILIPLSIVLTEFAATGIFHIDSNNPLLYFAIGMLTLIVLVGGMAIVVGTGLLLYLVIAKANTSIYVAINNSFE